jgi:transposase
MQAVDLFEQGELTKAEVARRLGVAHQTVSAWHEAWRQGGRQALRAAGRAGRLGELSQAQLAVVEAELEKGAMAHGYDNDRCTLERVAGLIEAVTGVGYHPHHVWRILREKLGWSCQRPARRATERDEEAVSSWVKQAWPKIKKVRGVGARWSSSRTNRAGGSPRWCAPPGPPRARRRCFATASAPRGRPWPPRSPTSQEASGARLAFAMRLGRLAQ